MLNVDILALAAQNTDFRREVATGQHSQVVLMNVPAGEEIGDEVHEVDQLLGFVAGKGEARLNDEVSEVYSGRLVLVPAGTRHNFINTSDEPLKLWTLYAPPEHEPGTVHRTKAEADEAEAAEEAVTAEPAEAASPS